MDKPSSFPFLTPAEFIQGCRALQNLLPDSVLIDSDLSYLRITRRLAASLLAKADDQVHGESDREIIEDDPDALSIPPQSEVTITISYDVVLSPSYRVPMVYMTARPPLPASSFSDLVVPRQFHDAMRETGIIGALSMTVIIFFGRPVSSPA